MSKFLDGCIDITMKKELAGTWKTNIGYWPVQINGNKFATGQVLEKLVEVVKVRILVGWAQKSTEPCFKGVRSGMGHPP